MDWDGGVRFGWTLNLYTLVENECPVNILNCFLEMASAQAHQSVCVGVSLGVCSCILW